MIRAKLYTVPGRLVLLVTFRGRELVLALPLKGGPLARQRPERW